MGRWVFFVLLFAARPGRTDSACRLERVSSQVAGIVAQTEQGRPLRIFVEEAPVTVNLGESVAAISVAGELAFRGTVENRALSLRLRPGARSDDGLVAIGRVSWRASGVRFMGGHVLATADPDEGAHSVMVEGAAWPCASLALGSPNPVEAYRERQAQEPEPAVTARPSALVAGPPLLLRPESGDAAGVVLRPGTSGLPAKVLAESDKLVRIHITLDEYGAHAVGWIERARLRAQRAKKRPATSVGRGGRVCGDSTGWTNEARVYWGPVWATRGAKLYVGSRGDTWATAQPSQSWEAFYEAGSEWVSIRRIPGVRVAPQKGCVMVDLRMKRTDVKLGVSRKHGLTLERHFDEHATGVRRQEDEGEPIVVTEVEPGSRWATLGLLVGDRVVALGARRFSALSSLTDIRRAIGCGGDTLHVERGGQRRDIPLPSSCEHGVWVSAGSGHDIEW